MPNQLDIKVIERRDNTDRVEFGNAAMDCCRAIRRIDGIISAKFYWLLADSIVFIAEGEREVLDKIEINADYLRTGFAISDMGRFVQVMRLNDPWAGQDNYQRAGRA